MSNENNQEEQRINWESRKETMNALYKRFMDRVETLDPYTAVWFTSPMCDVLLNAVSQVENYNLQKDGDDIINKALES